MEESNAIKLLCIVQTIVHQTTHEDHPTNKLEIDQHYYVSMLQNPIVIEEQLEEIVNLNEVIFESVYET
jgi:hypothetical protein